MCHSLVAEPEPVARYSVSAAIARFALLPFLIFRDFPLFPELVSRVRSLSYPSLSRYRFPSSVYPFPSSLSVSRVCSLALFGNWTFLLFLLNPLSHGAQRSTVSGGIQRLAEVGDVNGGKQVKLVSRESINDVVFPVFPFAQLDILPLALFSGWT